jgi:hypothetical protein
MKDTTELDPRTANEVSDLARLRPCRVLAGKQTLMFLASLQVGGETIERDDLIRRKVHVLIELHWNDLAGDQHRGQTDALRRNPSYFSDLGDMSCEPVVTT